MRSGVPAARLTALNSAGSRIFASSGSRTASEVERIALSMRLLKSTWTMASSIRTDSPPPSSRLSERVRSVNHWRLV